MTVDDLKQACAASWQAYTQHEFLRQLGRGSLESASFQHYLQQDYLFLLHFTRAWGLAIYKSQDLDDMRYAQLGMNAMLDTEIHMHVQYCQSWGITEEALRQTPESSACVAYTRYVLDCGASGSLLELHTALLPCLIGYAESVAWLAQQPDTIWDGNPYRSWMEMYASADYLNAVEAAKTHFARLAASANAAQRSALIKIFETATRMEIAFWDMGLHRLP